MRKIGVVAIIAVLTTVFATGCLSKKDYFTNNETVLIQNTSKGEKMMLWTIDSRGDSLLLREKAAPIPFEMMKTSTFKLLMKRMLVTVQDPDNNGVGIAAPQVGVSRRLIAVQRFDKKEKPFEFFVNPTITYFSEEKVNGPEGCLSIPGRRGYVERAQAITVEYDDPDNLSKRIETISGYTAIIFQHEIDHLDGILFIDRCKTVLPIEEQKD